MDFRCFQFDILLKSYEPLYANDYAINIDLKLI